MDNALDTPETIRQQMDETRSQLNDKLESLELQVAETIQSTGSSVNATVEAVQEGVESVSGAVQDAVQSVSEAFDIRLQMERHPLLVLGGAVVLGYLTSKMFPATTMTSERLGQTVPPSPLVFNAVGGDAVVPGSPPLAASAAADESGRATSSWNQLRDVAFGALMVAVQDVATRSVPRIVDYLTGESAETALREQITMDEQPAMPDSTKPLEKNHHFRIASSGIARTGNSF